MRRLTPLLLFCVAATIATAQWRQTAGPEGGHIARIVTDDEAIIVATAAGEVWTYEGESWSFASRLDQMPMLSMVGDVLLARNTARAQRSTDRGRTWTRLTMAGSFLIDRSTIYLLKTDSLHMSTDVGLTWRMVGTIPLEQSLTHVADGVLYGFRNFNEAIRSTDFGATWEAYSEPTIFGLATTTASAVSGDTVWVATYDQGMMRSTDRGQTWSEFGNGLPQGEIVTRLALGHGTLWAATATGTFRFDGTTWQTLGMPPFLSEIEKGSELIFATEGGVYAAAEGETVPRSLNDGFLVQTTGAFGLLGSTLFVDGSDGVYRTIDEGGSWVKVAPIDAHKFAAVEGAIFAYGSGFYRSTDGGATWTSLRNKFMKDDEEGFYMTSVAAHDDAVYATFGYQFQGEHGGQSFWLVGGVFRSTDAGETWTEVSGGLPHDGMSTVPVYDLVATPEGSLLITTATGIYRSTSRGALWTRTSAELGTVQLLGDEIWLQNARGLLRSSDGVNWTEVPLLPAGLPGVDRTSAGELSYADGNVYAVLYTTTQISPTEYRFGRLLYAFDGTSWRDATAEFPEGVTFTRFFEAGNAIYAATDGRSVWKKSLTPSAIADPASPGRQLRLAVGPNPFSTGATVRFTLDEPADVTLTLTNILGEEIAVLHRGRLDGGAHERALDGAALPAGRYLIRLIVDGTARDEALVKID